MLYRLPLEVGRIDVGLRSVTVTRPFIPAADQHRRLHLSKYLAAKIDPVDDFTFTVCAYSFRKAFVMSITFLEPLSEGGPLPLYSYKVRVGFPSPAADHIEKHISLDELLEIRAPHIYLVWISSSSMEVAGIFEGY